MKGILTDFVVDRLRAVWKANGWAWFEGELNLNLFGVRSACNRAGKFDDVIACAWQERGRWNVEEWPATTDPGAYYLKNPINVEGTAILARGQHRGAWRLGRHRGQYEALVQTGAPVKVWRDRNRDEILDWSEEGDGKAGWYGINIHRAGPHGRTDDVGRWSAGCQVVQTADHLARILQLYRASAFKWGERISYTLIDVGDLRTSL